MTLGLPGAPWPAWWAVLAAALLGVGAHLANVLPDIDGDLATGVRGLPQRLGAATVRALIPVPLLAATCLLVFGHAPPGCGGLDRAGRRLRAHGHGPARRAGPRAFPSVRPSPWQAWTSTLLLANGASLTA